MSQPTRPPTLADVARRAGVSVPTASRALNGGVRGRDTGDPELRARVRRAAEELGYAPSTAAQTIKDGRSQSIALIVNAFEDVGSGEMIGGVMHAAEDRELSVAVRTTHDDPQRELRILRRLRGERPRAVIIATSRTTDEVLEGLVSEELSALQAHGARIVVIGDSALPYPSVVIESRTAAAELARGVAGSGRTRFALVSGPVQSVTAQSRLEGFLVGLAEVGIAVDDDLIVHEEFSRDGGVRAVGAVAARLDEIDVIAAMSDAQAIGVMVALRDLGLHRSNDIAVAGFDRVGVVADLAPEISTVAVPLHEFGRAAVSLALDHDENDIPVKVVLDHRVVVGPAGSMGVASAFRPG